MEETDNSCGHAFCEKVRAELDAMEHEALNQRMRPTRKTVFVVNLNGCSVVDVAQALANVRFVADIAPIEVREHVASLGVEWFEERLDKHMVRRSNDLYDLKRAVCRALGLGTVKADEMQPWVRTYDMPAEDLHNHR